MKKLLTILLLSMAFISYSVSKPDSRISASKQKDLSGDWNDKDIRIVCETLV